MDKEYDLGCFYVENAFGFDYMALPIVAGFHHLLHSNGDTLSNRLLAIVHIVM